MLTEGQAVSLLPLVRKEPRAGLVSREYTETERSRMEFSVYPSMAGHLMASHGRSLRFDPETGEISGLPSAADEGTYTVMAKNGGGERAGEVRVGVRCSGDDAGDRSVLSKVRLAIHLSLACWTYRGE